MGSWDTWMIKVQRTSKEYSKLDYPGDSMTWGEGADKVVAKWVHIIWLYKAQIPNFKNNRNLQESVVFPGSMEKMKVSNAMAVFSKTMANSLRDNARILAELFAKDDVDATTDEILQTAQMMDSIDQITDLMNGSNYKESHEGPKGDVTPASIHVTGWAKFRKLARSLKFYDSYGKEKKNIPTIKGLIHNLSTFQDLWQSLIAQGFTSLKN